MWDTWLHWAIWEAERAPHSLNTARDGDSKQMTHVSAPGVAGVPSPFLAGSTWLPPLGVVEPTYRRPATHIP